MSNIIKKGMKSFHSSQLVSVCTRVVIEPGVYPQKLVCTPTLRSKGYMYPQFQNGVGMLENNIDCKLLITKIKYQKKSKEKSHIILKLASYIYYQLFLI